MAKSFETKLPQGYTLAILTACDALWQKHYLVSSVSDFLLFKAYIQVSIDFRERGWIVNGF